MMKKTISIGIVSLFVIGGLVGILVTVPEDVKAPGPTYVSGVISIDTTWTLADSPYIVVGDITVENGAKLTIEPGVEIKFNSGIQLFIDGSLIAEGTIDNHIVFTSNSSSPSTNDWKGIKFRDSSLDQECVINYGDISYAETGINCIAASPKITNSSISSNSFGIYADQQTSPIIVINNTITYNNYGLKFYYLAFSLEPGIIERNNISYNNYGMETYRGPLIIRNNTFQYNNGIALEASNNNIFVTYNIFINNNVGIRAVGDSLISNNTIILNSYGVRTSIQYAVIKYNNIYDNSIYDWDNKRAYEHGDIDARYNWWGTTNTTKIDGNIFDYYDDFNYGKVIYDPFLTELNPNASIVNQSTLTAISVLAEVGENITLNATLTLDIYGNPIAGEQVAFYIDKNLNTIYEGGEFIGLATTSASGVVTIPYTVDIVPENYGILARYVGSANYTVNEIEGLLTVQSISNVPPTIIGIVPDQIKPEDSSSWTHDLTPYEADVEDSGPDLKWYLTGVDTTLYSVTGMNSSDDVFTFIPVINAYGNDEAELWLEDSCGATASQLMWVNITPVNDIPMISNCPDISVRFNTPYTFNYTPYINDVDTPLSDIILSCSDPVHASVNGLKVTYIYPESRVGETILVTLTVSDGEGDDNNTLQITITSDVIDSGIEISSITLSKYGPSEGDEVIIFAEIQNAGGNDRNALVRFYDGNPYSGGTQIGSNITVGIPANGASGGSVEWTATAGNHTLYVLVENLVTSEEVIEYISVSVGENIPPVLVLTTGDINIYRFEPGQERTISVEITCYRQTVNNVRLVVLDDQNLTIDHTITPPITMTDRETTKFYLRIKAPQLPEGVEKLEKDILIQAVGDNGIFSNAEELDIVVSQSAVTFLNPITIAGAVITGSLATLGAAAAASRRNENWKYLLLLTFAVPLYTRIHGKKTLDNFVRGQVYGHIQSKPGTHFNEIRKTLKLGNGNLAYHLRKLEKEGFIISKRDKRFRRFYPVGVEVPEEDGIKLSKTQENLLDFIERHPKSNQKEIAKELKESQQTISYNINVLVRGGFLKEEKIEGTKTYEIFNENT